MSVGIIYKAKNKINNKVYVGQTWCKLSKRIYRHYSRKSCLYFYNAIHKYGLENFEWSVLFRSTSQRKLDIKEIYYINSFNSSNKKFGYNLQEGGRGGKPNMITRKKMSESAKRYFRDPQARKIHGEIQRKRFSNFSERVKHSRCHGGRQFFARKENITKTFQTEQEAAQYMGCDQGSVSSALRKKSKVVNGWIFSYKKIKKYIDPRLKRIIIATNINNGKIKEFANTAKAAKELRVYAGNIWNVLHGRKIQTGGWKFEKKF